MVLEAVTKLQVVLLEDNVNEDAFDGSGSHFTSLIQESAG